MAQDEKCLTAFMQRVDGYFKPVPNARMGENHFDVDFFELKQLSASLKQSTDEEYKSTEGYKADNRKKNRYKDIVPFDATRVKLSVKGDDPNTDYINASFIKGAENHSNYIASQGPLPHTILDFWQMLWQYNISVIVMVCREIELGKKKCERYWAAGGETKTFGAITVTSEKDEKLSEGYSLRVIKAVNGQETRYITQFHYTSWPDHGVPKTCYEILSLINHVREVQSYRHDVDQPLCVHCSAGCGRTGAVIVVDFVRNLLEKKIVPPNLKTFDIISNMRRQRPALVQTKEQYEFVNVAIAELFKVYIRTNTLERKDFSVGYQSEEYVNVNICSDSKSRLKDSHSSSGLSQYENFDVRIRANGTANAGSTDLNDIPPPKPSRPVSSLLLTSNPYANLNQKADTSIPPSLQRRPTPSPKPRGNPQNGNTVNMSPVRSLPAMPSADAGKSRVPTAKPNIPKIVSPVESQGIDECRTSLLHDSNAPDLSSDNAMSFSLTQSSNNNNNSTDIISKPTHHSHHTGLPSPVREKAMLFEAKDTVKPPVKPAKPKIDPGKLKIREDNDLTSESEAESPLTKGNFEKFNPRPPVKPKPRIGIKPRMPIATDTKENSIQDKITAFSQVRRSNSKPKATQRPLSQNYPVQSHSYEHSTGLAAFLIDGKKKPPPVAPKTALARSASAVMHRGIKYRHDYKRQDKSDHTSNETKGQVIAKNIPGTAVFYATTTTSHNDDSKPAKPQPKPHARHALSNNDSLTKNANTAITNPSYGLMDASKMNDTSETSDNKSMAGYVNTDFPNKKEHEIPQSYVNHVIHSENSVVEPRDYVNTQMTSKNNKSDEREYVNDPGNNHGQKDSHGSVQTTSNKDMKTMAPPKPKRSSKQLQERSHSEDSSSPNFSISQDNLQSYSKKHLYYDVELTKQNEPPPGSQIGNSLQSYQKNNIYNEVDRTDQGRRSQSSPIPPTVPMKTWESHVFLDDAPPALPERTPDSYCVIDGGQSGVQAYESFDTTAISTVPIPENNEATRRHSAVATSGNVGVKNMMATVFDKTTTAFAKVGATISKTGDDTNTGVSTVTLEDRKPTYTQEPTVYNGQDMSFGRRLLKKVRGPRKQK